MDSSNNPPKKSRRRGPEHTLWKPGQSGNPNGRPRLPQEIVEARKLTRATFEKLLQEFLWMSKENLEVVMSDPATDMLKLMVGSIVMRAVNDGCTMRLSFLLDRLIGKATFYDPMDEAPPTVQVERAGPVFVVELNEGGKFMRARPREVLEAPEPPKASNG